MKHLHMVIIVLIIILIIFIIYKLIKRPIPTPGTGTAGIGDIGSPLLSILLSAPTNAQDGSLAITIAGNNVTSTINIPDKLFDAVYAPKINNTSTIIYYVQYLNSELKFFDTSKTDGSGSVLDLSNLSALGITVSDSSSNSFYCTSNPIKVSDNKLILTNNVEILSITLPSNFN